MSDAAAMHQRYPRPPIIEAVIQLNHEVHLSKDQLSKLSSQIVRDYPVVERTTNVSLMVNAEQREVRADFDGRDEVIRHSTTDQQFVALISNTYFNVANLAPYMGWNGLYENFEKLSALWDKVAGVTKLTRIAVRYINRIDVPRPTPDAPLETRDYVTIDFMVPEVLGSLVLSECSSIRFRSDKKLELGMVATVGPSPVPNFVGLGLDLDLRKVEDLPQGRRAVSECLEDLHNVKNEMFEACITDKARALFS